MKYCEFCDKTISEILDPDHFDGSGFCRNEALEDGCNLPDDFQYDDNKNIKLEREGA